MCQFLQLLLRCKQLGVVMGCLRRPVLCWTRCDTFRSCISSRLDPSVGLRHCCHPTQALVAPFRLRFRLSSAFHLLPIASSNRERLLSWRQIIAMEILSVTSLLGFCFLWTRFFGTVVDRLVVASFDGDFWLVVTQRRNYHSCCVGTHVSARACFWSTLVINNLVTSHVIPRNTPTCRPFLYVKFNSTSMWFSLRLPSLFEVLRCMSREHCDLCVDILWCATGVRCDAEL